jgi:hypothetical protein
MYTSDRVFTRLLGAAALLALVTAASACGKKEAPPAPANQAAAPNAATPAGADLPAAASAAAALPVAPPPELGMPLKDYVAARVVERCAVQYHEDSIAAETRAVQILLGRPVIVDLAHVYEAPPKPGAKAAPRQPDPDTPEQLSMRQKFRAAHALAAAHTPTQKDIDAQLVDCVYAPEIGLVPAELQARYITTFVDIACLQRKHTDPSGQLDAVAHAQAAASVFQANSFNAGDFARYGMVFARFPQVQAKLHAAKAKACPDPRAVAETIATTGEWNGSLSGERNAALNLRGDGGQVKGGVQWLGATVRYDNGATEAQAIPVSGVISPEKVALFGEIGADWVRLEGKVSGDRLEGTWTAQRALKDKFKGTWTAQKLPSDLPKAATPAAR